MKSIMKYIERLDEDELQNLLEAVDQEFARRKAHAPEGRRPAGSISLKEQRNIRPEVFMKPPKRRAG
jgi:hypothetical protein